MFCPSCGSEERQASQYCRACGVDLRPVRIGLARPDSITESAVSARDEISRAVAQKIREMQSVSDLKKVVEEVLPELEKFLESPEEKRLRRVRAGVATSSIGMGAAIFMILMSAFLPGPDAETFLGLSGLGITTFLIGIGLIINALAFTKVRHTVEPQPPSEPLQRFVENDFVSPQQLRSATTSNLGQPGASVTEHTTLHLKSDR